MRDGWMDGWMDGVGWEGWFFFGGGWVERGFREREREEVRELRMNRWL